MPRAVPERSDAETTHASVAGLRILVVSHDYAPDAIGIAPYATETATSLAAAGAEVTVLTMPPHYPNWSVPAGQRRGYARERVDGVDVWRLPTYVPADPTLLRRLLFEGSWLASALPMRFRKSVREADLVVGMHPGLFASAFAAFVAGRRPLVFVVQDLVTQAADQAGMSGAARAKRLLRGLEARSLRRAAALTVPTPMFAEPLAALGVDPERISVVPNWSRVEPRHGDGAGVRAERGWADKFVVLHAGNMGLKQGLELLAPAVARAATEQPGTRFVFLGGGSQAQSLRDALAGLSNVDILPVVSDQEFDRLLEAADAYLVHERPTVTDMCLPSKLTTYFSAGRPVLAVTREDSATAGEVRRSGGGLVVPSGDPQALLAAVQRLRKDPALAESLVEAGRRHAEVQLSRERSLGKVHDLLARAAAGGRRQTVGAAPR